MHLVEVSQSLGFQSFPNPTHNIMKNWIYGLLALPMLMSAALPLRAQIVADGASRTMINETNSFVGRVIIGTNAPFTLLVLSDNALLSNSGDSIIGLNSTANQVQLISPSARWLMGTNLFVGSNGGFNRLTISNGGRVVNQTALIGYTAASLSNEVLVTGVGSVWSNSSLLNVGAEGSGNRLVISNGGRVSSLSGLLGPAVSSSNNTVIVTGGGATWNNQGSIVVGMNGRGCRMVVSNSAFVDDSVGTIGQSGSNCEVVVTGPGSVWSNRNSLTVGQLADAARLVVTNGGSVFALGDVQLGGASLSSFSNRIVVHGGTLRATNLAGTAALGLLHGTNLFNAGLIEADQLRMANTLGLFEFNGGLLTTRGAFISNGLPFVVGISGTTPAIWDVRAGVTNYFLSSDLHIGSNASFNQLVITNGALLNNNNGILGSRNGANSNLASIAGINSVWSNRNNLDIGNFGVDNKLIVSNGGWLVSRDTRIGANASSSSNFALVTGSGSVWSNRIGLIVGNLGSGNRLGIEAGGRVYSDSATLGSFTSSSNNEAVVTGPGSVWTNRATFTIGNQAGPNRLVVSNGATLWSGTGVLGNSGASNQVVVTGASSLWTNQTFLLLGGNSVGNQVDVRDGGWLACADGAVGQGFNANSNTVLLSDSGSGWNNLAGLTVGDGGSGNVLIVSNGATVLSSNGTVGASTSLGNNNLALLTGNGTVWSNQSSLNVGRFSFGNRLVASDGANLFVGENNAVVGVNTAASSNSITLTGAGTRWLSGVNSDMIIGSNGAMNRLVISNGAVAESAVVFLGYNLSSSNNEATITGPGAALQGRLNTIVGRDGAGTRLTISNGGFVASLIGLLGSNRSGSNSVAIVTGPGSTWSNRVDFHLGGQSSSNRLMLTNGGQVIVRTNVFVGAEISSSNNLLTVDGGTLRAVNPALTGLLDIRRGTAILNAGTIEVDQLLLTNMPGRLTFNGGLLSVKMSTSAHSFQVGNGVSPATFQLAGNGNHNLSAGFGVLILSNATLTGNGTLTGHLAVLNGGKLNPGASVGKIVLNETPALQGTTVMEISKNGAALTNDQVQVLGALTYNGSLQVSHLGPTSLSAGDSFQLFQATSYSGSFSSMSLPLLGPELTWTNKLLVDGSIEVIPLAPGDHFWTNAAGGNYDIAVNWLLNSVPGVRDNAVFTNNAGYQVHWLGIDRQAANAFFNAASGIVTQALFNSSWTLTNSYIVGRDSSATAAVTHSIGFLRVTNSEGTARLVVGEAGRGTYSLSGGDVLADFLIVTNNGPGFTNSIFNFTNGTLTTLHGSRISQNNHFTIAGAASGASWTMSGGENVMSLGTAKDTRIGSGGRGVVTVSNDGTGWSNSGNLHVGYLGSSNELYVSKGAKVTAATVYLGTSIGTIGNQAFISDLGSVLACAGLGVGDGASSSRLVVTNRGAVLDNGGTVGATTSSSNNSVLIIGPGSFWNNVTSLEVGFAGSSNSLVIASNGLVTAGAMLSIGFLASSSNNVLTVLDSRLIVTNSSTDAQLQVGASGQGALIFNGGNILVDRLLATNGAKSIFNFNAGTLQTAGTTFSNGLPCLVGDGLSAATLELLGDGAHTFAGGLQIANNALLKGNGTIVGNVTNFSGGALCPGASIGQLAVNGRVALLAGSSNYFEISKAENTNDNIVASSNVLYGGTLIVTNLGGTLTNGDSFKLFTSTAFSGSFSSLVLPPLDVGLSWKNNLRSNGSLQVVVTPNRDFGVDVSHFQNESGIPQTSWDQMFAEGKRFVFIKATEGLTGPHDATMSSNVTGAMTAGLLAGVYHFAHPENRPTTNGAILEASNMVVYAGSAIGPGRLRPVLDLEGSAGTLSTTALTDWVIAFSDEIIARRGPGAAPIVYCSQSFANNEFDSRLATYDLWLRTVNSGVDIAVDDPPGVGFADPTGVFENWSFWQYSATGSSGGISPLDLNVCHTEYKPLSSYLIPGAPPMPIQIAGVTVTAGGAFQLSFTNTPGTLFTVLATTNAALPLSNWTVLGVMAENSPGEFQFTDSQATNSPQRFYQVRSP